MLEIARWVFGVRFAWLAGQMAFVIARFIMALLGEGSYAECSVASLNPVTRWLMYYFAVPVVTVAALLVYPSWAAGIISSLWVAWRWFRGTRAQSDRVKVAESASISGRERYKRGMKRKILSIAIAFGLSVIVASAQSRYATILISPTNPANSIAIGANEVASFKTIFENSRQGYLTVDVTLGSYTVSRGVTALPDKLFPIKGPATITLKYPSNSSAFWSSEWISWLTLEIIPESFPPDKTLIIPEGTGARVALECSTNLLSWSEVWSGVYTNAPSNQFFRLSAQRLP